MSKLDKNLDIELVKFIAKVRLKILAFAEQKEFEKAWNLIHKLYLENFDLKMFNLVGALNEDSIEYKALNDEEGKYGDFALYLNDNINPDMHLADPQPGLTGNINNPDIIQII